MVIEKHKVMTYTVIDRDDPNECGSKCPFHNEPDAYCSLFDCDLLAAYDRCDSCRENIDAEVEGRIYDSTSIIKQVEEELEGAVGLILSKGKDNLMTRRILNHIYDAGRMLGVRLYRIDDNGKVTKRGKDEDR